MRAAWGSSVAGQSILSLSSDTLYFPGQSSVTLTNVSSSGIVLDSVNIGFAGPRAYWAEFVSPNSSTRTLNLNPYFTVGVSLGALVPSGEIAVFRVLGFDPCVVCSGGGGGFAPDTLRFYSQGSSLPKTVMIDVSGYVSIESAPEPSVPVQLTAYPNPTSSYFTLDFGTNRLTEAEIMIVDAVGRTVAQSWLAGHEESSTIIDASGLKAGVYYVVAEPKRGTRIVAPLIVVH